MMNIVEMLGLLPEEDEETKLLVEQERECVARDEHPFNRGEIKEFARFKMLRGFGRFELHMRVCPRCRAVFTSQRELVLALEKK